MGLDPIIFQPSAAVAQEPIPFTPLAEMEKAIARRLKSLSDPRFMKHRVQENFDLALGRI
jgi:hypothetical protein